MMTIFGITRIIRIIRIIIIVRILIIVRFLIIVRIITIAITITTSVLVAYSPWLPASQDTGNLPSSGTRTALTFERYLYEHIYKKLVD